MKIARHGVAMLTWTVFIEGIGRYERLFKPNLFAQFVERVPMVKGRLDQMRRRLPDTDGSFGRRHVMRERALSGYRHAASFLNAIGIINTRPAGEFPYWRGTRRLNGCF
jgi:hypothetical protein